MNGTVAPPSRSDTAAATCASRTPSSSAMSAFTAFMDSPAGEASRRAGKSLPEPSSRRKQGVDAGPWGRSRAGAPYLDPGEKRHSPMPLSDSLEDVKSPSSSIEGGGDKIS